VDLCRQLAVHAIAPRCKSLGSIQVAAAGFNVRGT
jgi:hypothetical protein